MGKGIHSCWACGAGFADPAHDMLKCRVLAWLGQGGRDAKGDLGE